MVICDGESPLVIAVVELNTNHALSLRSKCRPEYKVPGLYVIDSIVRQSRHQFGYDKDVFGPRFTRNFKQTFHNLFLTCPVEDKPKIVRVLNLWQRNNVFSCDVIQPLLDMANPNAELKANTGDDQPKDGQESNLEIRLQQLATSLGMNTKSANGSQLNLSTNNDSNQIRFNKKLLDFDYGDDDDKGETPTESEPPLSTTMTNSDELSTNPLALSMAQNLLLNPDLVQKLRQSFTGQSSESSGGSKMIDSGLNIAGSSFFNLNNSNNLDSELTEQLYSLRDSLNLVQQHQKSGNDYDQFAKLNKLDKLDAYDKDSKRRSMSPLSRSKYGGSASKPYGSSSRRDERSYRGLDKASSLRRSDRRNSRERRHRSRSPRVTSSSGSNKKDQQITGYQQTSSTVLSPESKEKERERERRKKGLPSVKKNYVTICSTTLWLGHLPKSTSEVDISDAFGEYGTINTIDLISARGCAYVCMNRRQDAYKALQNLKNLKLHNSHIKMAWAPGKGMKGKEFKDYWDVELGVSYIPFDKLSRDTDFELLEDGGMVDEESMTETLLELRKARLREDKEAAAATSAAANETTVITSEPAIVEQPPIPPSKLNPPTSTQPTAIQLPTLPIVSIPNLTNLPFPFPPPPNNHLNPHHHPHIPPRIGLVPPPLPVGPHLIPPPHLPSHIGLPPPTTGPPPLINHPGPHILPPLPPNLQPPVSLASSNPPPQVILNKPNDQDRPDSLNNGKMNNNSIQPWLAGAPPLQPPFNDMFEPNLLLNQMPPLNHQLNPLGHLNPLNAPLNQLNPQMLQPPMLPFDENNLPNMQFNDNRDMFNNNFGRDNWRRKDQQQRGNNNRNNRFNNSLNYNNEDRGFNDSYNNKRKRNDNFNNNAGSKNFNTKNANRNNKQQQGGNKNNKKRPNDVNNEDMQDELENSREESKLENSFDESSRAEEGYEDSETANNELVEQSEYQSESFDQNDQNESYQSGSYDKNNIEMDSGCDEKSFEPTGDDQLTNDQPANDQLAGDHLADQGGLQEEMAEA